MLSHNLMAQQGTAEHRPKLRVLAATVMPAGTAVSLAAASCLLTAVRSSAKHMASTVTMTAAVPESHRWIHRACRSGHNALQTHQQQHLALAFPHTSRVLNEQCVGALQMCLRGVFGSIGDCFCHSRAMELQRVAGLALLALSAPHG